jgi:hypothetical protein
VLTSCTVTISVIEGEKKTEEVNSAGSTLTRDAHPVHSRCVTNLIKRVLLITIHKKNVIVRLIIHTHTHRHISKELGLRTKLISICVTKSHTFFKPIFAVLYSFFWDVDRRWIIHKSQLPNEHKKSVAFSQQANYTGVPKSSLERFDAVHIPRNYIPPGSAAIVVWRIYIFLAHSVTRSGRMLMHLWVVLSLNFTWSLLVKPQGAQRRVDHNWNCLRSLCLRGHRMTWCSILLNQHGMTITQDHTRP